MSLRLLQIGLGPIGLSAVARCLERPNVHVLAAVDTLPDKSGRYLSELLEDAGFALSADAMQRARHVYVYPSLSDALSNLSSAPDAAIHTTGSFLQDVGAQLIELASAGIDVVSTCEELSFPWWHHREHAEAIDRAAKRGEATLLGTGVNPGFAMDLLPLVLSGAAAAVDHIAVRRVVDAGKRRGPLQRKVGAGLTRAAFVEKKATGRFGHAGLPESLAMIAHGLGWQLETITSDLQPKVATTPYTTEHVHIEPGHVLGIDQTAVGTDADGRERLRLRLEMYVGAPDAKDTVRLQGSPPLELTVTGGIPGDVATVSSVLNALPQVMDARPGLLTVLDLPVPRCHPLWTDTV